jgi:hypothetical protein
LGGNQCSFPNVDFFFATGTDTSLFNVDEARFRISSKETAKGGAPCYALRRITEKTWMVTVANFKYFELHLQVAKDKAVLEMQHAFESMSVFFLALEDGEPWSDRHVVIACRGSLREITGVDNDLDTSLMDAVERISLLYGGA